MSAQWSVQRLPPPDAGLTAKAAPRQTNNIRLNLRTTLIRFMTLLLSVTNGRPRKFREVNVAFEAVLGRVPKGIASQDTTDLRAIKASQDFAVDLVRHPAEAVI